MLVISVISKWNLILPSARMYVFICLWGSKNQFICTTKVSHFFRYPDYGEQPDQDDSEQEFPGSGDSISPDGTSCLNTSTADNQYPADNLSYFGTFALCAALSFILGTLYCAIKVRKIIARKYWIVVNSRRTVLSKFNIQLNFFMQTTMWPIMNEV